VRHQGDGFQPGHLGYVATVGQYRLALFFKQKRRPVVKRQLLEPASQARLVDDKPPPSRWVR
jgi:hypothetical protein